MKKVTKFAIRFLFHLADKFFLQKNNIVFSTRAAKAYADNSKVLFERFASKGYENVFYFTKKKELLSSIPKNGIYAYSMKAIIILLKSKILVFTHGSGDFFPYFPNKHPQRTFINLFHAIPIKYVGIKDNSTIHKEIDKWDYFLVSSPFERSFIKKQYFLKDYQIIEFGQPRNDIIIKNAQIPKISDIKLVLYAPTFRKDTLTKLFPFDDANLISLDNFLIFNGIKIMIRLHINEENKHKNLGTYKNLENIFFKGSNKIPSINDYLHNVDMLISDYSSITLDYLLLDRPIAYIPYDYVDYNKRRGFSFDYHKHRAGPILNSQEDLISFIKMEKDDFINKRATLKNKFHKHQDGKSTDRLFNFVKNL